MKKHASIMGLAIRMTWLPVLLVFVAVGAAQWLVFDPVWYFSWTFESMLENGNSFLNVVRIGKAGTWVVLAVLILSTVEFGGVKFTYTLRRLSLGERRVTWEFGLVFAGDFFLYWIFQLGMVFALYCRYARWAIPGQNLLFLAAYRSDYFHTLLPLKDAWGYVRNILVCLSCGCTAALVSHQIRHGQKLGVFAGLLVIVLSVTLPAEMASIGTDLTLCVLLTAYLVAYGFLLRGGDRDED